MTGMNKHKLTETRRFTAVPYIIYIQVEHSCARCQQSTHQSESVNPAALLITETTHRTEIPTFLFSSNLQENLGVRSFILSLLSSISLTQSLIAWRSQRLTGVSQERSRRYPCGSVWLKIPLGDSVDDPADELLSSSLLDGELG
jgi:hypothetical protein